MGDEFDLVVLRSDDIAVAVMPEAGARLHSLRVFGAELLRSPADPGTHLSDPFFWGAYHMVPWCNRIDTGPVGALQRTLTLASNFPDGTAIHGRHYVAPWEPLGGGAFRCHGGGSDSGWPWTYTAVVAFAVQDRSFTIDYTLTNTADEAMPGGVGFHPWLVEPDRIWIPSSRVFPDNTESGPEPEPVAGPLDLRDGAALMRGIDASWVDLTTPEVAAEWDALGIRMTMAADMADVVVPAANIPGADAIAIEMQTHAPGGIRRLLGGEPYGLAELAPGASLRLGLTLTFATLA